MKVQTIKVYNDDLSENIISIPVQEGEKILSTESYVKDAYIMYAKSMGMSNDDINQFKMMESNSYNEMIKGDVVSTNGKTAIVQVSPKHTIEVKVECERPAQLIEAGSKIDLSISKRNKKSEPKTDATSETFRQTIVLTELIANIGKQKSAYLGHIYEVARNYEGKFNGYNVMVDGVKCFIPISEVDVQIVQDESKYLGQDVYVMPINYIQGKNLIVSHKKYLSIVRQGLIADLLESKRKVDAVINAVKEFGVFVTIDNCINALLSNADMDAATKAKMESHQLKDGDVVSVMLDAYTDDRAMVTQTSNKAESWNSLGSMLIANRLKENKNYVDVEATVIKSTSKGYIFEINTMKDVTFFVSAKFANSTFEEHKSYTLQIAEVDVNRRSVKLYVEPQRK